LGDDVKLHKAAARLAGWELQHIRKDQPTLETHLQQLLPKLGIDCLLDVGANHGQYGSMLRRCGYKGHIASFEPVKASFEILRARAAKDPQWNVYHYALGAKAGESMIHVSRSTVMASFLDATEFSHKQFPEGMPVTRDEKVTIRTLDDVFSSVTEGLKSPRVFLKMDTQGYDLQVFAGAKRTLPQVRGLQTEISIQAIYEGMPDYLESLATYTKAGFVMSGLYPVSRDKQTLALIELDCVMRRAKMPEQRSATNSGAAGAKKKKKKTKR
jgi:FkbM family methyltransferase